MLFQIRDRYIQADETGRAEGRAMTASSLLAIE